MFYNIVLVIVRFVMLFVFRIRIKGYENVPADGGVIFAINHTSNWDPVIAGVSSKRPLRFMAKEELFKNPVFGFIIKKLGAFPIRRGRNDIGAIKSSMKILGGGDILLMFPEGHRVKNNRAVKAKPGVAMIAHMAKVPVVPVNISGKYAWMQKITVTYGRPIYLDEYFGQKLSQEKIQEIADGILNSIRELNPKLTEGRTEQ